MRRYKKVFIALAASILFLVIAGITLSLVYEKRISQYLVSELNEKMEAEIRAKNISFSLLEKFPFASIRLDSMSVIPKDSALPELYAAKTTFLEFNIIDVFSGNYTIRNIEIRKGNLNVATINDRNNFSLFRETNEQSKFSFALRNVRLTDLSFSVSNNRSGQELKGFISTGALNGKFSESEFTLKASGKGKIREVGNREMTFLKSKEFDLTSELYVRSSVYTIKDCHLELQGLNFLIEGEINDKNELTTDLKIRADNIAIADLYKLLPEKLIKDALDDYESEGDLNFNAVVKGPVSSSSLSADFSISKGKLIYKPEDLELKNIMLSGKISNGKARSLKTTKIILSDFYAETRGGRISGRLTVSDLLDPAIDLNIKATTSLEQVMPFVKQDVVSVANGKVEIQAYYAGPAKRARTAKDLAAIKSGGMVRLKNVGLELKSEPVKISGLTAMLLVDKNDLMISSLDLVFNGSSFGVKGRFENFIPSLFSGEEKMKAFLDLSSPDANLAAFLQKSDKRSEGNSLVFPFSSGRMNMTFAKARYERFNATDVSGTINLENETLQAENISFNTMNGSVKFNGKADFMVKGVEVKGHALLDRISVTNLFYVFNNFGQTALTDQQIKGEANAEINFQCFWDHKFDFDPLSLYALCDINIDKGELNGFEPLYHMSNFISLSELKNIRFSRLHNNFIIKDGKVIFPEMVINSNAINLTCSGTHYFSNKVDYHFELSLNDLLWQKAKNAKPVNQEFGVEEDDGLGKIKLHLSMAGDISDPHFTYDKRSMRKDLQEEARKEKLTVKGMLKKDLGMFRADSTVKVPEAKKEKAIGIEWKENEQKTTVPVEKSQKEEKDKGKVGKLLNKIAKPGSEEKSDENSDDFN